MLKPELCAHFTFIFIYKEHALIEVWMAME